MQVLGLHCSLSDKLSIKTVPSCRRGRFIFFACLCILSDSNVCSGLKQQRSAPDPAQIRRFESLFFRHSAQSGHIVFECCRTVRQHTAPFELSQIATTPFLFPSQFVTSSLYAAPVSKFWTPVAIFANCENGMCLLCSCPHCGQLFIACDKLSQAHHIRPERGAPICYPLLQHVPLSAGVLNRGPSLQRASSAACKAC